MKYRKPRIGWSCFWAIACVLLVVLWVRSYSCFDSFGISFDGERAYWLGSVVGELRIAKPMTQRHGFNWKTYGTPAREWVKHETPRRSVLGFSLDSSRIIVPHWFSVVVAGAIAGAPWMRFSLRALLIAMTLVAAGLGVIVYAMR
jgi:hypothetical protein